MSVHNGWIGGSRSLFVGTTPNFNSQTERQCATLSYDTNSSQDFKYVLLKYVRSTTGTTCFFSQMYHELNDNTATPCICTSFKM